MCVYTYIYIYAYVYIQMHQFAIHLKLMQHYKSTILQFLKILKKIQRNKGGRRGVQDGGTQVYPWLIHVKVWQKPPQYRKVISLQL